MCQLSPKFDRSDCHVVVKMWTKRSKYRDLSTTSSNSTAVFFYYYYYPSHILPKPHEFNSITTL